MEASSKRVLIPYEQLSPGFEAVYTGGKTDEAIQPNGWPISRCTDDSGNIIEKWSVWTWQSNPSKWDEEINHINAMQKSLGPIDDDTRQIRAHIGSLVLCEAGIPVTIDNLLEAVGRGRFLESPLHDGCWCCGMWWKCRGTQHGQPEAIAAIEQILAGYRQGRTAEDVREQFPDAAGFMDRVYRWLPSVTDLSQVQRLMLERMLLPFDWLTGRNTNYDSVNRNCFEVGGHGLELDSEISKLAGLPRIHPEYTREFRENVQTIGDSKKEELYRICGAIAHGLHGLSDCHHSTFRWIERWIHDIGTLSLGIPERPTSTERQRLLALLFGYQFGLDSWLMGTSMQFLLMDLAYADLGFNPKNEILRVYTYLGSDRTGVKEWLAACLWKTLFDVGNPRGIIIRSDLIERAEKLGVSVRRWMGRQLRRVDA